MLLSPPNVRRTTWTWMRIEALSQYKQNFPKHWAAICSLGTKLELSKYKTAEIKSQVPCSWRMEPSEEQWLLWRERMTGPTTLDKVFHWSLKKMGYCRNFDRLRAACPSTKSPGSEIHNGMWFWWWKQLTHINPLGSHQILFILRSLILKVKF